MFEFVPGSAKILVTLGCYSILTRALLVAHHGVAKSVVLTALLPDVAKDMTASLKYTEDNFQKSV